MARVKKQLLVWIESEMAEKFKAACDKNCLSKSEVLRQLILAYIKRNRKED